jgi:hypothetical protein
LRRSCARDPSGPTFARLVRQRPVPDRCFRAEGGSIARGGQAAVLAGLDDADDEVEEPEEPDEPDEPDDVELDDEDELSEEEPAGLLAGVENSEDLLSDLSVPPLAEPAGTSEAEPERESVR